MYIILVENFVSEVEKGGHGSRFVITSQKDDPVRIVNLQSEESQDDLKAKHSTIYVVTHKYDTLITEILYSIQHVHQVIKLAMYVSYYCARLRDLS